MERTHAFFYNGKIPKEGYNYTCLSVLEKALSLSVFRRMLIHYQRKKVRKFINDNLRISSDENT